MRIEKATTQLLNTEIIRQIIPTQYLGLLIQRLSEGALMNLIICDEIPVGFVALIDVKTGELMTVIHQNYRRKGFIFQACIKTINESFEEFDLKEIIVKTQNNSESFYLAEKLGFTKKDFPELEKKGESMFILTKTRWEDIIHFQLTEEELTNIREACFSLASNVNWTKSTDTEDIINQADKIASLTEEVYQCSISYLLASIPLGCDSAMMIRVINYIAGIHAVPAPGCDLDWYKTTLYTLIDIACPNYEIGDKDEDFIEIDVRRRVNKEI